jgi:D-beta-D-heptose 7-phosphate kinase/D-beta-D-heptose 1-phosphate adenosyltransferase
MQPLPVGISQSKINFTNRKVLIIGDVILDKYVFGSVNRISPEAPVPVVRVKRRTEVLGGAANVAHNIVSLGGQVHLVGLIGEDENGVLITNMLSDCKVSSSLYKKLPYTISKTRIIGEHQQIARIDSEPENFVLEDTDSENILSDLTKLVSGFDCLVISDYAKGLLSDTFTQGLIKVANSKGVQTIIDPKGSDWEKYRGASLITPNLKELSEVAQRSIKNENEDVVFAAKEVMKTYNVETLLVTRSEKGMSHVSELGEHHAETVNQEVYDVSGAGDTVVSMISLTVSDEYTVAERLLLANAAAGIVVGKVGTASVTVPELISALSIKTGSPVLARDETALIVHAAQENGKKIVFTNGCFDILHKGHISYLEKARACGDILVLGLNSDDSVRRLKGPTRPINNELDRAFMLLKLAAVDYVTIFDEDTPLDLIRLIKPDVLAKGADYTVEEVVGREHAKEVRLIDFVEGYSTSTIIEKSKRD